MLFKDAPFGKLFSWQGGIYKKVHMIGEPGGVLQNSIGDCVVLFENDEVELVKNDEKTLFNVVEGLDSTPPYAGQIIVIRYNYYPIASFVWGNTNMPNKVLERYAELYDFELSGLSFVIIPLLQNKKLE